MLTLSLPHWFRWSMASALREGDCRTAASRILARRSTRVVGATSVLWGLLGVIFIHLLACSTPCSSFIGSQVYITPEFTTCAVFYIHWVLTLCSPSYPPNWIYPAPKAAILWWPVTERCWAVYSPEASSIILCLYSQFPCYCPAMPVLPHFSFSF